MVFNSSDEILRRRTFAIISHPDAGKTTLTEKLLLYGGALQLAGSVRMRKNERASASDWMELERKRGISVSSTVLQFDYRGTHINLLDTPGHKDFSEDTYRVLTAVDSVIMVIDSGKGIESQTRKLFEVCARRGIPIFTFMNKLDRPTKEPLELMDELEKILGIEAYAMNWPLDQGIGFKGLFNRQENQVHWFERTAGGASRAPVHETTLSDPSLESRVDPVALTRAREELEVLNYSVGFDQKAILAGKLTPVFFGSATNNFGVQLLLDNFIHYAPPPQARVSSAGVVPPERESFSGFIFKIQGNMDPRHRDRVAFLRVVSGKFTRGMPLWHSGSGRQVKINNAHSLFGQEREIIEEAYPGDILGLVSYDGFGIGDTLSQEPGLVYHEIPHFPPECFSFIENPNPSKYKPFRRGLEQLLHEGVAQALYLKNGSQDVPLLAAVGPLQFEVLQYRLESEYGAPALLKPAVWQLARWIKPPVNPLALERALTVDGARLAADKTGQPVILFPTEWHLQYLSKNNPELELLKLPPDARAVPA
ncbi:MAG: peptide chain release factor 3 [Elusimicrobiota bacterium]